MQMTNRSENCNCDSFYGPMLTLLNGKTSTPIQRLVSYKQTWIYHELSVEELEINKLSALNSLRHIKYSITHKHTFAKANNDHAAPPLKTPKGHLIGQWM